MRSLKSLFLATAIASCSANALALEFLDEGDLSDTVAQQGMDIFTNLNINNAKLTITDGDGYGVVGTDPFANAGNLNINGLDLVGNLKISVDVGSNATTGAALFMNITGATASDTLVYRLDGITVNKTGQAEIPILTMPADTTITIGAGYRMAVELGSAPSTHLAVITGNLGSLTIGNTTGATQKVAIADSANGGTMGVSQYQLSGLNLGTTAATGITVDICNGTTANANCAVGAPGLKMTYGSGLNNVGLAMDDIRLGSSTGPIVGRMTMTGLDLTGTSVRMVGH